MHEWTRWIWPLPLLLGLWLLTGCDALDTTPGQADFRVTWPQSASAQSLKVQLIQETRVVKSLTVNRVEGQYQSLVMFDNLQMESTEFVATLYEHPDAVGAIRGQVHGLARVVRKNPIPHDLVTDLAPDARLEIFPLDPMVYLDETLQLFAVVRNADNSYVLTPAGAFAWSSSNAETAEIVPANGLVTGMDVGETIITAAYGTLSGQAILQVKYPPPTVDLKADDTEVDPGDPVRLSWTSTNATRVDSVVNFNTYLLNGSLTVYPMETTEYRITVKGPGGTATDTVTVTVNQPVPTVTLTASSTNITKGSPILLTWTSQYATSVISASNFNANDLLNGAIYVTPDMTTTYAITVQGPGGTQTASVTVYVNGT